MNKLMFSVALAATTSALCAQEMGSATTATVEAAVTVTGTTELTAAAEAANADGGQEIADKAVEKGAEIAAEVPSDTVSADDQVAADLDKMGLSVGYAPEKKAIIQTGTASVKIDDPANDPAFAIKREQIANFAYLNAKAEVIKAINADFSAVDRAVMMMDESVDENAEKVAAAKEAVEAKRAELVEALSAYNTADAKSVADVTLNDRFNAFLDAVIKTIDKSYDPATIAAAKKIDAAAAAEEAAVLKAKARQLAAEYKALEDAAAKLPKDPALETSSAAKIMAKMPLLGSSIITQAESWDKDEKIYTVSMAIVWSPKLQESAMKMGTGDFSAQGKPGKFSKSAWVKAQDWSSMVGGRRFTDDKGRNLFIGISSVDLSGPVVKQNAKKKIADTMAIKNVAMSLLGDLETYREASQNMKVYADDSASVSQKLSEATSAKVSLNLKGCMQLATQTVKHPITGKKIYVSAYYIDPSMAAEASKTLEKLFADAALVNKYTQKQRGKHAGMQKALDTVKASTVTAEKAAAEGVAAVNGVIAAKEAEETVAKVAAVKAEAAKKATATKAEAAKIEAEKNAAAKVPAKSTGGTFSGGTIDTDF